MCSDVQSAPCEFGKFLNACKWLGVPQKLLSSPGLSNGFASTSTRKSAATMIELTRVCSLLEPPLQMCTRTHQLFYPIKLC